MFFELVPIQRSKNGVYSRVGGVHDKFHINIQLYKKYMRLNRLTQNTNQNTHRMILELLIKHKRKKNILNQKKMTPFFCGKNTSPPLRKLKNIIDAINDEKPTPEGVSGKRDESVLTHAQA